VAALTLALGIGVNSAIFALADAALMRPLPFGQPERLVMIWERTPTLAEDRRVAAQPAPTLRGHTRSLFRKSLVRLAAQVAHDLPSNRRI
jgi:hypothetical protein